MREEEERVAEEKDDDEILLTYDRPELANKVILRRHSSTGMWEVCSPSTSSKMTEMGRVSVPHVHDSEASFGEEHPQEIHAQPLTSNPHVADKSNFENDCETLKCGRCTEQHVKRRSPRSLPLFNKDHLPEQLIPKAANRKKIMDPDYVPLFERTGSGGVSKQRNIDRDLKSPRLCLSPALPYTCIFARSQPNRSIVGSNQLYTSAAELENDGCIGSRTRQRATNQAWSKNQNHSPSSSPVYSSESSPSAKHKYPTRRKTAGQS